MSAATEELDHLSREDLIARARVLGVERAELMTRVELKDEIIRRSEPDAVRRQRSRGWLGVARDLVASVVEAGLNMRDTAALIRGEGQRGQDETQGPAPVATVTLAEIYAAQGHFDRALNMIEEVLQREPDHEAARALRERLRADRERGLGAAARRRRVATVVEVEEPPPADFEASEPDAAQAEPAAPEVLHAELHEEKSAGSEVSSFEAPSPRQLALAVVRDGARTFLYWEVPPRWLAAKNGAERKPIVARALTVLPGDPLPQRTERDLAVAEQSGGTWLPALRDGEALRAALGYVDGGRFRALCVASELWLPSGQPGFRPLGFDPSADGLFEVRAVAHVKSLQG